MKPKMKHTIPYNFIPRPYQRPVFHALQQEGKRRALLCWHRRAGKDKTCLNLMIALMAEQEAKGIIGIYYYFLPTFAQGRKVLWDAIDKNGFRFIDHFPKDFVRKVNDAEMQVVTKNGSVFQVIGTDNYDAIRGTNPLGCVFSEYSLQRPEVWRTIQPILSENGGWAIFNFTPKGRNHAWQLLKTEQYDPDWFCQILTVEDTKAIPEKELEKDRRTNPRDFYEQEYLCVFTDGAGQFFKNLEACLWEGSLSSRPDGRYQAGVDLAKVNDFTVLTVIDLDTRRVGKQLRFNKMDYTTQQRKILDFYEYWNQPKTYIDKNGVGQAICDFLCNSGLYRLEPFQSTAQSRNDLLLNLQLQLETQRIRIPNDETLLDELRAFRYQLDEHGQTKIVGIPGIHDDMVMSLALAVWDLPHKPTTKPDDRSQWKERFKLLSQFDSYKGKPKGAVIRGMAMEKRLAEKEGFCKNRGLKH